MLYRRDNSVNHRLLQQKVANRLQVIDIDTEIVKDVKRWLDPETADPLMQLSQSGTLEVPETVSFRNNDNDTQPYSIGLKPSDATTFVIRSNILGRDVLTCAADGTLIGSFVGGGGGGGGGGGTTLVLDDGTPVNPVVKTSAFSPTGTSLMTEKCVADYLNAYYATTASLSNYATTASLANYATTSALSNYVTNSALSGYGYISGTNANLTSATLTGTTTIGPSETLTGTTTIGPLVINPPVGSLYYPVMNSLSTDTTVPKAGKHLLSISETNVISRCVASDVLTGSVFAESSWVVQPYYNWTPGHTNPTTFTAAATYLGLNYTNLITKNAFPGTPTKASTTTMYVPMVWKSDPATELKFVSTGALTSTTPLLTRWQCYFVAPGNGNYFFQVNANDSVLLLLIKDRESASDELFKREGASAPAVIANSSGYPLSRGNVYALILLHLCVTNTKPVLELSWKLGAAGTYAPFTILGNRTSMPNLSASRTSQGVYVVTMLDPVRTDSDTYQVICTLQNQSGGPSWISVAKSANSFTVTIKFNSSNTDAAFDFIIVSRGNIFASGNVSQFGLLRQEGNYAG